jgi:RNA polymerase sigma-70 factor (ECF subfamily)
MTEQELIKGVISRERAAIAALVEIYQAQVIKTAYYFLGNMQDAEDLAQDVFLEVLNSVDKFRQTSALSTWIYRVTVNRSLNMLKKKKRMMLFQQVGSFIGMEKPSRGNLPVHSRGEDTPLETEENRKLLEVTIDALPENQRTAFILSKYEELSYKEIAEVMGLSLGSVESLIHRAKLNLQKCLASHFSEYSKRRP